MVLTRRLKRELCGEAEPSSGTDANTTTTNRSKRLRVSHDAVAEPSSSTTTTTVTPTSKRLRGSHAAESGSKRRKMEAPDASSRQDPSPGKQDAGKAPDASSGPDKKRKAWRPKLPRCRRFRELLKEERRAWKNLKAAGLPLLTRSEVATMCRGEGSHLGEGAFGTCVKGRDPRTGLDVVVKSFRNKGLGDLEQEAAALWALRYVPGLQRLVGACLYTNQLVTLFAGENLYQYFKTKKRRPAATALSVFQQTTRTLQAMGKAGYAHNDIKPHNACAREQEGRSAPEVTVIDMGMAVPVGSISPFEQTSCTNCMPWVAPELLLHTGRCGEASDAYGLAFCMQKLLKRAESSPSLAPVHAWLRRARSRDPHARPGLAELQEVLQTALAKETMH